MLTDRYFLLKPADILKKSVTPHRSKGELKIRNFLINNDINFIEEYTFDDLKDKSRLRFDFYLPDLNLFIEYDGEQHFKENIQSSGWNSKKNYDIIKYRDNYKNQWCKENNILLIRIPYTHYDEICIEDLLPNTSTFLFGGY